MRHGDVINIIAGVFLGAVFGSLLTIYPNNVTVIHAIMLVHLLLGIMLGLVSGATNVSNSKKVLFTALSILVAFASYAHGLQEGVNLGITLWLLLTLPIILFERGTRFFMNFVG